MTERTVAIFGATGSIGMATLDVVQALTPLFRVGAVSAHNRLGPLYDIASRFGPDYVICSGADAKTQIEKQGGDQVGSGGGPKWLFGPDSLAAVARLPEFDVIVAAIVGSAGVSSTLAALETGKRVALANKETLVCAGPIVAQLLAKLSGGRQQCGGEKRGGTDQSHASESSMSGGVGEGGSVSGPPSATPPNGPDSADSASDLFAPCASPYTAEGPLAGSRLVPVDSEHSAIFQCLQGSSSPPHRLILTASGGPFRGATFEQMRSATVQQALNHPTWNMGRKITIDSATMMNKALELIEARWLFGIPAERLEVVIHPQSIIHSLVEFVDGSVISQLSPPDMRLPIQYALTYPDRVVGPARRWNRQSPLELTLEPVDHERFPAIKLGFEVARVGGSAGAVLNAANEAAVDLFLNEEIRFTDIVRVCRAVLDHHTFEAQPTLERLMELDRWARAEVRRWSCHEN